MKLYKKLWLCVLVVALLCICALPPNAHAADVSSPLTFMFVEPDGSAPFEFEAGYIVSYCDPSATGELVIPATYNGLPVIGIGTQAFIDCTGLTSITIPDSVIIVGPEAFSGCYNVTEFYIEEGNVAYHSTGNCLIETESKTLIAGCKASQIPSDGSVTNIGMAAFRGCKDLTSITIPDSIISVDREAFSHCTGLTSVIIGNGVTDIGYETFAFCDNLTNLLIGNSVTSIGSQAFQYCSNLTSIVIPSSVTSIGSHAFSYCTSLTNVTIPESVTTIGSEAFNGCGRLSTIIYCGTQEQWDAIDVGGWNEPLTNATLQFHNYENGACTVCRQQESNTTISVSTDKDTYYRGDTVTVTVSTSAVEHCVAGGFLFEFDTNVFEYVSGQPLVSDFAGAGISTANGKVTGYFMGGDKTVQGEIFQITLKVKEDAAFDSYTISGDPRLIDDEGNLTCVANGITIDVVCRHSYGDWKKVDGTTHKHICSICSNEETVAHAWNGTITTAPTCTVPGVETFTCSGCQDSYTETVSATGHTDVIVPGKTATCTETGLTEGKKCSACGVTTVAQTEIAKAPHAEETIPAKAASCTETGLTEGKKCSSCDKILTAQAEVPAVGHSFDDWFKANDSYNKRICSVCSLEEVSYIDYTVVFTDWDGTVLSTNTYHWGDRIAVPANPTREADNTFTYSFLNWGQTVVNCAGNATYTATYTSTYIDYTVEFKNWDGTVLTTQTYHYGDAVAAPADPAKAADNTYTYAFAGWDATVANCTGNAAYTATYTSAYIDYTVEFKDWNGTVLATGTYHYGDAVTAPANPTRAADNTYTYAFAGWDADVVNCAGNATYTATYTSTFIEYTVVFKNWDGKVISTKTYHYGNKVTTPANPTRTADKTYTYAFNGWDADVVNCAGDATYTATYTSSYIDYAVVFKNWDGTVLATQTYHYGDKVTAPADPTRAADERYTYAFTGWDKGVVNCAGNTTYTATYSSTLIDYTVVFQNWDGTVISTKTYHYGNQVTVPANPTKASDNTYAYTFAGWDAEVVNCAGNATYTATYTSAYIDYTVEFKDWNGTVLATGTYHYGDAVTAPAAPTRAADNTYTYAFAGWDAEVVNCAGNATYTATYTPSYIDYTIQFKDWDGTVLATQTYHYGDAVTAPAAPTRAADNTYTYAFAGWDAEVVNCAGNATYTATYNSTYIDYTVQFKDWNGTVLATGTYHYGDAVTAPANPTRAADNTYTYAFAGWDADVVNCAGNATYTATYTSTFIEYTVVFKNWDGKVISTKTYHYGNKVTTPANPTRTADKTYTYAFNGWDADVVNCAGDATYTATYTSSYIDYAVVFKNWDGTVLATQTYHYGDKVTAPADPTRAADERYTYAFTGWDKGVVNCAGNTTYTATYSSTLIDYTVVFQNWDGTVISTKTYHYGNKVTAPADPAKAADNTYTYAFAGWDKNVVNCEGNVTYTATYTATYIEYTVTFQYADGTVIQQYKLHYGDTVVAPEVGGTFSGWDKAVVACAGDATYTAVFEKEEVPEIPGDVDGSQEVTQDDVVYLLLHTMFGEESYPTDDAPADIDCNGTVDEDDVVYLLLHAMFGEMFYPLNTPALPVKIEE